jgi:Tol biopolymer transport system component
MKQGTIRGPNALIIGAVIQLLACGHEQGLGPRNGTPGDTVGVGESSPFHHEWPAWSSQGQIAYHDNGIVSVARDGSYSADSALAGLWVLDIVSRERRRILPDGTLPNWSPNGDYIVFVKAAQIHKVRADGSGTQPLTTRGGNAFPSWSPDGKWIVFDSNVTDARGAYVILLMRPDGTDVRDISTHGVGEWRMPSWSASGSDIIHIRYIRGEPLYSPEIYRMKVDGTEASRVTTRAGRENRPVVSSEGRIAFTSNYNVWVIEGAAIRQVTRAGGVQPSWSADGGKLVYVRADGTGNSPGNGVLWIHDLASGAEEQLTQKWPQRP